MKAQETRENQEPKAPTTPEFDYAVAGNLDIWVPACGGMEKPHWTRNAHRVLYVFNPCTGKHGYLEMSQDVVYETLAEIEGPDPVRPER